MLAEFALPVRDIKCRAVVGGSADKRQSRRDVDAIVKAKQFQRDMPLIVVHRHHHIVLALLAL